MSTCPICAANAQENGIRWCGREKVKEYKCWCGTEYSEVFVMSDGGKWAYSRREIYHVGNPPKEVYRDRGEG